MSPLHYSLCGHRRRGSSLLFRAPRPGSATIALARRVSATTAPTLHSANPWPHAAKSRFHVGDRLSWNSEAGRVRRVIKKKLTAAARLKGYIVRASKEEPQYVIQSDRTDHVAVHKGSALRKLRGARVARGTK
jgi:hypothetical protein